MRTLSSLPVRREDLQRQRSKVEPLLRKIEWTPHRKANSLFKSNTGSAPSFARGTGDPQRTAASLIEGVKKVSGDDLLVSGCPSAIIDTIRTGFSFGLHLFEQYARASGLDNLISLNSSRSLPITQEAEYHSRLRTASAVLLFSSSNYIKWELSGFEPEKVSPLSVEFKGLPEIDLSNPIVSMNCQLFYMSWYIEQSGVVGSEYQMVKFLLVYCEALLAEIRSQVASLEYTESFTQNSYKIDDIDFAIDGFKEASNRIVVGKEFKRVTFDQIVGNRDAKHSGKRLAQRLACYDPVEKDNPFRVLGGMSYIRMGSGKPGTGKSLQIAATATMCHDLCEKVGLDFIFNPLPETVISTFQGGSGERMDQWFEVMRNPNAVSYSPIDDGENNLQDRTQQGVSAGVREVIGVFLRGTEGAGAVNLGNGAIDIMTNLPEQIDAAVLSRIQERFSIDGAVDEIDFSDQDYLWWSGLQRIDPKFVDIRPWEGREYMSTQGALKSLAEIEEGDPEIKHPGIAKIVAGVKSRHKVESDRFFADLYYSVQQVFSGFTSRDVRNIQSGISLRIMDFDIPDDWFDDLSLFFEKTFEEKLEILKVLMRENMKGLSFVDLRYRTAINYIDKMAQIGDVNFERDVLRHVEHVRVIDEAQRRLSRHL